MAEYIDREAAIQVVKHAWSKGLEPSQYIEIIPSADVEPVKHGKWRWSGEDKWNDCYECSSCGKICLDNSNTGWRILRAKSATRRAVCRICGMWRVTPLS